MLVREQSGLESGGRHEVEQIGSRPGPCPDELRIRGDD